MGVGKTLRNKILQYRTDFGKQSDTVVGLGNGSVVLDKRRSKETAVTDFRSSFRGVAIYLGRPSSDTVLFSGVPAENLVSPTFDEVQPLAQRIGLEVEEHSVRDLRVGNISLPAIVILEGGRALSLIEAPNASEYRVEFTGEADQDGILDLNEILSHRPVAVFSFSVTYSNAAEHASVGLAAEIERPHWLRSTLAPFWRTYLQVALAALFINIIALASPLFVMNVYDRVLPNHATSTLWVLAIGVSMALLFDLLLKSARATLIDYAGRKADVRLSHLLFDKILNSTLASRPLSTGEYASRVTQYEFVREFFTSNTVAVLIDSIFVLVFLLVIYLIGGLLVVVPLVAFLLCIAVGLVAQMRIGQRVAAAANEAARRQALLVETISTLETVKSVRAEANLMRRWQELTKHSARTSEQIKHISSAASNASQFVQQLVTVGIILIGTYQFAEGNISMGSIIATVMLSGRAIAPLGQVTMTLARLRQATMSLRILDGIMNLPEDRPQTVGFVNRQVRTGALAIHDVGFAYPQTDHLVLNGLSLSIKAGERVGIIGRIGSGKTTVGRLLAGLYPPTDGRITLDGIDIRQYHPAEVRAAVAVAGQSADLFSGTVKENLLIGRPDASDEEIIEVARATGVDAFVSRHPRGFDMPVGERGNNLSGGQKQALTIARLLLSRPRIVYLDEPSGAMDLQSERQLIARLRQAFAPDVTVIIATHRYSMLELVDRLIVMDQGKVIADGPKKDVIDALQRNALGTTGAGRQQ